MEFRCPPCKEITENEFIDRIYDEMKYQCLGCHKEWKIIFVENKSIPPQTLSGSFIAKSFHLPFHEIYGDNKKTFYRQCGLTRLNSDKFKKEFFDNNPCIWPNDYDKPEGNK